GASFLGEVFLGFFLTHKTNVRKIYAQTVPRHHLAIIIIFIIFALFKYECGCEWCLCLYVRVVSEVALELSLSLIQGGPPCPCVVKKV
ncbi:hypothetical protein C0J52_25514, partial [Blattella germanica]